MQITVMVKLDMTLLDDAGNEVAAPAAGTPEHDEVLIAAREAVHNSLVNGNGSQAMGFAHDLSHCSSIIVGTVEAADSTDTVTIEFDDGETVTVSRDHKFLLAAAEESTRAEDLQAEDQLADGREVVDLWPN